MFAGMGAGRRLDRCRASSKARCLNCQTQPWPGRCLVLVSPSHGENRGSSPLGSANKIKHLIQVRQLVSNNCPINVYRQRWTSSRGSPHIHALWRQLQAHPIHRVGNDLRYGEVALKFLPRSCPPGFFPSCEKQGPDPVTRQRPPPRFFPELREAELAV